MSSGLFDVPVPAEDTPRPISRDDKRRALDREIAMRRRVYPGWVAKGRMSEAVAAREIAVMEAIRADFEGGDA